ncbi:MAG: 1-acyl-sn-glycerol-3-phosphate acyltransferase [Desulfomonilaceae bacterium]
MTDQLSRKTVPDFLKSDEFRAIPGVFDREPSLLMKILAGLLSPKVKFDDQSVQLIRELSAGGPIVYALKYPTHYDLQYLRMRLAGLGLPAPCFLLGSAANLRSLFFRAARFFKVRSKFQGPRRSADFELTPEIVKDILVNRGAGAFFLIDENATRDRYVRPAHDPINILIEAQSKMPEPIAIVPVSLLYDRRQRRQIRPFWETLLGDPDQPGAIQRILIAFRKWTLPELLVGTPVHLIEEFEEFGSNKSWEDLNFEVRRELIANINDRIRVSRGPEKLSRMEIKDRVLQDPRVQKAVSDSAESDKTTEERSRKKAEAYVDEIAADQRLQMIHFLYYVLGWLFKRILDKLDYRDSDFSVLKKANEKNSVIFVSCHKSHLDYLVIGYILFTNQMPLPFMAAGKNLSFWPIGHILRQGGAFFIRRSFKGLLLYTRAFASYVQVLVKEKININFYIEGGRSRTGKFLPPKVGMLGFLLDTVFDGIVDDLTFIPTFAGYDRVPEEKAYLQELRGSEKQKESFFSFLESRKILKTKYGAAYVRFHKPVSFTDFLSKMGFSSSPKSLTSSERRDLVEDFAFYLMTGISQASVITFPDLAAAGLVCHDSSLVDRSEFLEAIDLLEKGLRYYEIEISGSSPDPAKGVDHALEGFMGRKFIELEGAPDAVLPTYVINESRRVNLEFYKNSLVNCLWAPALMATVILDQSKDGQVERENVFKSFSHLKELLNKEFIFDPLVGDTDLIEGNIEFLEKHGWIKRVNSTGLFEVTNHRALEVFKGLISDIFRVYKTCGASLGKMGEEILSERDFIKLALKTGSELGIFPSAQNVTLSTVTVRNALSELTKLRVAEYNQIRKKVTRGKVDPTVVFQFDAQSSGNSKI